MAYGIAENGVTSFLPTTMTVSEEEIVAALNAVRSLKKESETWGGAEILGVHAEGPFINPSKKGAQKEECIQKPNAKFLLDNADIILSLIHISILKLKPSSPLHLRVEGQSKGIGEGAYVF